MSEKARREFAEQQSKEWRRRCSELDNELATLRHERDQFKQQAAELAAKVEQLQDVFGQYDHWVERMNIDRAASTLIEMSKKILSDPPSTALLAHDEAKRREWVRGFGAKEWYVLVARADGNNPTDADITLCDSLADLYKETLKAVFGPDEKDWEQGEVDGILDAMKQNGFMDFEGDPPIYWFTGNALTILTQLEKEK